MTITLKPIEDQVIVITGASSGIGLATARLAAAKGARLVIAARSHDALQLIASEICGAGGEAIAVQCDVAEREQVERVAHAAIGRFGCIDTWVNNAGIGMFGRADETDDRDARRLFDTNFWGVVNGSNVALTYLRRDGGALINVGIEISQAAAPLLAIYNASKHAVKGFTDTLRAEIEELDGAQVAITLIEPSAVNTPFAQHARNYTDREPALSDTTIEPGKVAEAILDAARTPTRVTRVGMGMKLDTATNPASEPPRHPAGALHHPSSTTPVVGQTHGTSGQTLPD